MKKSIFIFLAFFVFFSCQKEETSKTAPELPPAETMIVDFSQFGNTEKSAALEKSNWLYSAATVGIWNGIIGITFAVPVAAFKSAFNHHPGQVDDSTWEWQYTVDGFTSQYTARLVGELQSNQVNWEMYITKTGINSFDEFLWFEGTSAADGKSGQWILYHSAAFPEKTVQIDWKKEAEEVGEIKYTYVREQNSQGQNDPFNGSHLTYGLKEGEYNIYVNVHAWEATAQAFRDSYIEWNRTEFYGRVKAEHFFSDTDWHCWDSEGNNTECD